MATATLIDRDNQYAYGVTSLTLTGITWTAGDEYIVVIGGDSFGGTVTVSDADSGTWAQILNQTEAYGEMWIYRLSGGSPSGDISIAFSGGGIDIPHAHLYGVSPDSGTLTYEAVVGYNAIGAGTGATPRPVDASAAGGDNLVLAVGWISAGGNAFTANWTKLSDDHFDNNNRGIVGQYKSDGGGETAEFTFDPTRPNWMAAGVEVSESGGGGGVSGVTDRSIPRGIHRGIMRGAA